MKIKKINFKQPKYIFPLVILLPLLFLGYTLTQFFSGSSDSASGVVTDSINMSLPDARSKELDNKMTEMNRHFSDGDAFTAVDGIGEDKEALDSTYHGYSESEMNAIDKQNAERKQQLKAEEDLRRSLEESRKHINFYAGGGSGGSSYGGGSYGNRSQQDDLNDYAREIERIQNRSMERQRKYYADQEQKEKDEEARERQARIDALEAITGGGKKKKVPEEKPEKVEKVKDANSEKFNTVSDVEKIDEPLIKAMIDKTTKAREGTRLRFKLLDEVSVKGIKLKKGSYLYGIVTGFGQQRVKASITSILVGNKFIKVNLSVYDNDGMEGFYVPASTFREMVKDAGASVTNQQITFDTGGESGISPELIALQALQNMYQSASSAVSNNIRKNKARIKYNTIVYLINTDTIE